MIQIGLYLYKFHAFVFYLKNLIVCTTILHKTELGRGSLNPNPWVCKKGRKDNPLKFNNITVEK